MSMMLKMAWRNLWRNTRRTIITISAIALAVLWSSVLISIQKGTWDSMIDNVSRFYMGYAQIHSKGYWTEQSLDLAFDPKDANEQLDNAIPEYIELIPRIESFALSSFKLLTKGVMIIGIDPAKETNMTGMGDRIVEGRYLTESDTTVLLGDKLADRLKIQIGDSIILISQGYHGQNAVGKYAVKGLIHFNSPDLNKQIVIMPLALAQTFYGTGPLITTYAVHIPSKDALSPAMDFLTSRLDTTAFEVLDYNSLIPELLEAAAMDTASAKVVLWILYLLIGFGLFGTILMMTKERNYEFGVLTAIGTERYRLAGILWIESILLTIIGALAGIILCLPIVYYLHNRPIRLSGDMAEMYDRFGIEPVINTAFNADIFIEQGLIMMVLASIISLYPVVNALRLNPLTAMKN